MKYIALMLLAFAIGCSKPNVDSGAGQDSPAPGATAQTAPALTLPDGDATKIKFTCPGMT